MYIYTHYTTQRWRDMIFIEEETHIRFIYSISQPETNGSGIATKFSHFMSFYPTFVHRQNPKLSTKELIQGL